MVGHTLIPRNLDPNSSILQTLQIQEVCPRLLLPVLPQLDTQLHGEAEQGRLKAVRLLGKLFSHPRGYLALQYPDLLAGLLLRLKDTQARLILEP